MIVIDGCYDVSDVQWSLTHVIDYLFWSLAPSLIKSQYI